MKIGLLGTGKTGARVMDIHEEVLAFDTSHPPTPKKLDTVDVIISFLPGDAFLGYIDMLLASGKPVVTGSTGFEWPADVDQRLKEESVSWVRAHNFSLGMNVVKEMIRNMAHLAELFEDGKFRMHEIHHVHKKDAPSGTALTWKEWLDREVKISSERKGDVIGLHELQFDCEDERITLTHKAKDRSIFARGAVWAAEILYQDNELPYGLLDFNKLVMDKLKM